MWHQDQTKTKGTLVQFHCPAVTPLKVLLGHRLRNASGEVGQYTVHRAPAPDI